MEELRNLILGPADQRLERIQYQLDDPDPRARDISRVLSHAVSLGASRDSQLAHALQPLTAKAIRDSIQRDRQVFVDVLFPVMGPALRKAIATTIQGLIQNFNQILEHSISMKGLRWRLEALRTRRPFAEVVLLHTLVYQVEQVFLIHRESGLLIEHVVNTTAVAQNPDLVSGMLTAIKDFVQDSFGAAQEDTLDTFQVGGRKVWIEHGSYAMLALVISGNPSVHLQEMMRDALDEIHVNQSQALKSFGGDTEPFEETRPTLNGLLQVQFKTNDPKKSYGLWIVIGVIFLLIGWGMFHWTAEQRRWPRFIDRLQNQPGIVVTGINQQDGKHHVYGLKDPYAPEPSELIGTFQLSPTSVVFHWEPYQSAFPEYAQQRIKKLFKPPASIALVFDKGSLQASGSALHQWIVDSRRMARIVPWIDQYKDAEVVDIDANLERPDSVSLTLEEQTLYASGSAPRQWIARTRLAAQSLPGLTAYNDAQLVDADLQTWESLTQAINSAVFYFESGRNALVPGQEHNLQVFIKTAQQLIALAELLDRPIQIDIVGHADQNGDEAYNQVISRRRAQTFADMLAGADLAKTYFSVHAAGSEDAMQPDMDADNHAVNRRVIFAVRSGTR
ncbi:OmpA family protein [Desulfosarcina sp.]|uniref:OmpA family protein n=1 Tax=Desulfosarcina sp. TaxID=2027861 RepID=UPI0029B8CA8A|nr:OmpA family protein [Desulfosarcina sp.]MDX2455483.1 OmpA family protein [Desulfosarcina sp.]